MTGCRAETRGGQAGDGSKTRWPGLRHAGGAPETRRRHAGGAPAGPRGLESLCRWWAAVRPRASRLRGRGPRRDPHLDHDPMPPVPGRAVPAGGRCLPSGGGGQPRRHGQVPCSRRLSGRTHGLDVPRPGGGADRRSRPATPARTGPGRAARGVARTPAAPGTRADPDRLLDGREPAGRHRGRPPGRPPAHRRRADRPAPGAAGRLGRLVPAAARPPPHRTGARRRSGRRRPAAGHLAARPLPRPPHPRTAARPGRHRHRRPGGRPGRPPGVPAGRRSRARRSRTPAGPVRLALARGDRRHPRRHPRPPPARRRPRRGGPRPGRQLDGARRPLHPHGGLPRRRRSRRRLPRMPPAPLPLPALRRTPGPRPGHRRPAPLRDPRPGRPPGGPPHPGP
ncbi:hypothetical protein EDD39_4433 [Kitasatospora cineracea]|uniref:Uncharacterized protein n=1 Tax=Kitasatospora cineracea TaxID=88074 RepID=A0A8G1XEH4_9ACTN|nr:hypothetical protein EDD39_4433 [Kitasatospora cineracea]